MVKRLKVRLENSSQNPQLKTMYVTPKYERKKRTILARPISVLRSSARPQADGELKNIKNVTMIQIKNLICTKFSIFCASPIARLY